MEFFQNLVYSGDSDIIFVNETWLKKDIYDLEILHSQVILFLGIIGKLGVIFVQVTNILFS
jgi:hypothetical protein